MRSGCYRYAAGVGDIQDQGAHKDSHPLPWLRCHLLCPFCLSLSTGTEDGGHAALWAVFACAAFARNSREHLDPHMIDC